MHGVYKMALDSQDIKVIFKYPYHPQRNGLCERTNQSLIHNIRTLFRQLKTVDWKSLTPLATETHNYQTSVRTCFSHSELFFFARYTLLINPIINSETTALVQD